MNREELEKMFDDNFYYDFNNGDIRIDLKKYIFDTIIPEVIKEILPCDKDVFEYVKNKSKQKFGINL